MLHNMLIAGALCALANA
jgi:hypothetical protein